MNWSGPHSALALYTTILFTILFITWQYGPKNYKPIDVIIDLSKKLLPLYFYINMSNILLICCQVNFKYYYYYY